MENRNNRSIEQNTSKNRFEITLGGITAYVDYIAMGKKIIYTHTEVPSQLEGQGLGSSLARSVMEYAREHHLEVIPLCPFLGSWLRNNMEYKDVLAKGVTL